MRKNETCEWAAALLLAAGLVTGCIRIEKYVRAHNPPPVPRPEVKAPPTPAPQTFTISTKTPTYLDYPALVSQLKTWCQEAPGFATMGVTGKSARGVDIAYIKVGRGDKRVLVTAAIHGNEPWSTGLVMAFCGNLLHNYGRDNATTELLNGLEVYFVPVVSPDSYPHSRHVDGVDPNRDFPTERNPDKRSTPAVQAVRDFYDKIRPDAVISGHTWGRACLVPWGDKMTDCPHADEYKRVIGRMAAMMDYRYMRACDMYGPNGLNNPPPKRDQQHFFASMTPIYGSEVDWYYRGGTARKKGAMAVVMEIGTHQRRPTHPEIKTELDRTWGGFLHFLAEAPKVAIEWN